MDGLSRITATLKKNDVRDDHGIIVSKHASYTWSWKYTSGAVKFVWEGDDKAIIGQTETTFVSCGADRTYHVEVSVFAYSVAFADDACGTLALSETLGAEPSLYVYVGASNGLNPSANGAEWDAVAIWGAQLADDDGHRDDDDDANDGLAPSPAPTESEPADLADPFDQFDSSLWLAPCGGCSYYGGALYVAGQGQVMRTRGSFSALARLGGTLVKNDVNDDHALVVSTSPAYAWSSSPTSGSVRFGWAGDLKQIVGQAQTASSLCGFATTYAIDVALTETAVLFADDQCGSLTLADEALGAEPSLYVYVGADDDVSAALWLDLAFWGVPAWDYSTPGPSASPTPLPAPQPSGEPSGAPTANPSSPPTRSPSPQPAPRPSAAPVPAPSPQPTSSFAPTAGTPFPTSQPSPQPAPAPSRSPSHAPTGVPSPPPLPAPTVVPLPAPTAAPTAVPTLPRDKVAVCKLHASRASSSSLSR